jgi:hypothetical protein
VNILRILHIKIGYEKLSFITASCIGHMSMKKIARFVADGISIYGAA